MKPTAPTWSKAEIRQFLKSKMVFVYASLLLWVVTAANCLLLAPPAHPALSSLDRIVGTAMDNSFVGPATNALFNYALDSPGVKDTYRLMAGIGPGMVKFALSAATIINLSIWCYLLVTDAISAGRANKQAQQASAF